MNPHFWSRIRNPGVFLRLHAKYGEDWCIGSVFEGKKWNSNIFENCEKLTIQPMNPHFWFKILKERKKLRILTEYGEDWCIGSVFWKPKQWQPSKR